MSVFDTIVDGIADGLAAPVTQLDLTVMESRLANKLHDPDTEFTESAVVRPPWSKQTEGPHRYTIYVPHNDGSRLSIGAAPQVLGSAGITGETRSHIHWYAYEACPTYLSLGAPSETLGPLDFLTSGYKLVTDGNSNHLAKKHVCIASQTSGVALVAGTDMMFSAKGGDITSEASKNLQLKAGTKITIAAGTPEVINATNEDIFHGVLLTAVDAADFAAPAAGHVGPNAEGAAGAATGGLNFLTGFAEGNAAKLRDAWAARYAPYVDFTLKHAATMIGLYLSYKKARSEPVPQTLDWKTVGGWGSLAFSVASEIKAWADDIKKLLKPEDPGIVMEAESSIGLNAKASISLSAAKSVDISGFKSVSISGVSVSAKGHKEGAVWGGMGASLKSLAGDAVVSSDLKGVTITGKKDVMITSEVEKAVVGANKEAELRSKTSKVYVHGFGGVLVACGAEGTTHGAIVDDGKLQIGTLKGAKELPAFAADPAQALATFESNSTVPKVTIQASAKSSLTIEPTGMTVNTPQLTVNGGKGFKVVGDIINFN